MTRRRPSLSARVAPRDISLKATGTRWWRALLSSAALVLVMSPSNAATIEAIVEGTLVSGFETGGLFLPAGTLFQSAMPTYKARLTYDTSLGVLETIGSQNSRIGGTAFGTVSPVTSAEITINGVTEIVTTERFGEIIAFDDIFSVQTNSAVVGSVFSNMLFRFVEPTLRSNLDVTGVFDFPNALAAGSIDFQMFLRSSSPTGVIGQGVVSRVTLSRLTDPPPPPAAIPLPAPALLLLTGLGGLGLLRRRR